MSAALRASLLVVVHDVAVGAGALRMSAALARRLDREVEIVYVESESALLAAALPATRVLSNAAIGWRPFDPADVERGFRAHEARLGALAARVAADQRVRWSLRRVRGEPARAAVDLASRTDLLLYAPAAAGAGAPRSASRHPVVLAPADGEPGIARIREVAETLSQALAGTLRVGPLPGAPDAGPGTRGPADVWVLPRASADRALLEAPGCALLLVG